jgi:hypothetical protein
MSSWGQHSREQVVSKSSQIVLTLLPYSCCWSHLTETAEGRVILLLTVLEVSVYHVGRCGGAEQLTLQCLGSWQQMPALQVFSFSVLFYPGAHLGWTFYP